MKTAKYIICRACALPKSAELHAHWDVLKELIEKSSPTLSGRLKDVEVDAIDTLDQRTRFSVERYFNRARFRPVPYGEFATVGLLKLEQSDGEPMLSTKSILYRWRDWTKAKQFLKAKITWADAMMWQTQSTCYMLKGIHYFFQYTEGQAELFSLDGFEELDQLLKFCSQPKSTQEIKCFAGDDWDFYRDLLAQLLELQVLVHSGMPNITGEDYFERTGHKVLDVENDGYTIGIRHADRGFRSATLEGELGSFVAFAQTNLQNPGLNDLNAFKQQFIKRYENQWQPLAEVIDPNQGLGYAGLFDPSSEDLAKLLPKPENTTSSLPLDELSKFLLNGMLSGKAIDLANFKGKNTDMVALPNTLSVLLQPTGDEEWVLEHIGGASAVHLLGRFAKDKDIASFAQELVDFEQRANAQVKFFDIAYQTGDRTDNINRRPQLYPLELALGGWSTHPEQLQLSDLFINVIGGELVLYSERHQCRVVPRMASAYNILRSSHPLFRLLADLQYQGIHHHFLPDVAQYFPDLDYYPPVRFGKLLLNAAKWKVPLWARSNRSELNRWIAETISSRWVKIGHADQYLCLDLTIEMDRELLWDCLQRDAGLSYLVDWATGAAEGILDANGDRFAYQFNFVLSHHQEIYAPITTFKKPEYGSKWPIGNQWLFMSIYASSDRQPLILRELVAPFLMKYGTCLENWFYILYADPEKHLRLRFKWYTEVDAELRWKMISELGNWLGKYGIVNTNIKPYEPEWQRYGITTMGLTERFFGLDSVEGIEAMGLEERERLAHTYSWIWGMTSHALSKPKQQQLFLERMANNFANEMRWDKPEFKMINQYWRAMEMPSVASFPDWKSLDIWEQICTEIAVENQEQYLADLIHMHVNRRFPANARVREAQLYQYALLHAKRISKLAEPVPVIVR